MACILWVGEERTAAGDGIFAEGGRAGLAAAGAGITGAAAFFTCILWVGEEWTAAGDGAFSGGNAVRPCGFAA